MDIKKFARDMCTFILGAAFIVILIITIRYVFRLDRYGAANIDWADCVKINNNMYYGDYNMTTVENTLVGEMIGKVKFNVSRNVGNIRYRFRNGDASYLMTGTEIYSLPSNSKAIAVKVDERYYLYINNFEDYDQYFRKNNP